MTLYSAAPSMAHSRSSSVLNATTPNLKQAPSRVTARFLVQGSADPGLLPRLLEPFAKLGTAPNRVHASREAGDGSTLTVDLRVCDVSSRHAELIEMGLRRIVGISQLIAVIEAVD